MIKSSQKVHYMFWRVKSKPFENSDSTFYNKKEWRMLSKQVLSDDPFCNSCKLEGKVVAAEVTDHIVPIKKGGERYNVGNFQSLCKRCHAKKSAKEK